MLLGRGAWAYGIRLLISWGQERVIDIGRLGNFANINGTWRGRRLRSRSIGKSSGTGRGVDNRLGEGEGLDLFVLDKTPNITASVFGVQDILQLLLITTADPEEDGQSNDGDGTDASHHTTDNGTDDRGRDGPFSKADLIVRGIIGVPDLDNSRENG